MERGTWKAVEREVAEKLGGRRVPVSGRQRGDQPDVQHPYLSIECKAGKVLNAVTQTALDQAIACAAGTDKTPIAVLVHCSGRGHKRREVVVMELKTFIDLYGSETKP